MRRCSKCGAEKGESEFGKDASRKGGLRSWCRECERAYHQSPAARMRRRAYERDRMRDPSHRERVRHRARERYRNDPAFRERQAAYTAARKYGIPVDAVRRLQSQANCDCCGKALPEHAMHRHIDHCHETGRVRGMVCRQCNLIMQGPASECIARMRCCIAYLSE